jgi:mono/diheme cytochrome c family protein
MEGVEQQMKKTIPSRIQLFRRAALSMVLVLPALTLTARAEDGGGSGADFSPKARLTFSQRCSACHTYGKGIKVGPDLKGVNDRRKHEWLLKFIHQSSAVIKSGDPTATTLFEQFKHQRMPDWTDLSEQDINDILHYLQIGGPDIKPADERNAQTATAAEEEAGRRLFYGETAFKYGAEGCSACHRVGGREFSGGSLGPDLTSVYLRYQDMALTSFLRHPCFRWDPRMSGSEYLTPEESFSLKAFLRRKSLQQAGSGGSAGKTTSGQPVARHRPQEVDGIPMKFLKGGKP